MEEKGLELMNEKELDSELLRLLHNMEEECMLEIIYLMFDLATQNIV